MSDNFIHQNLKLVTPAFNSDLTKIIMELQYLRKHNLGGSTPPQIFFQLKDLFHMLESINSARIEGNRTTLAEAVEARIFPKAYESEKHREIWNNEAAMRFIEGAVRESTIVTKGLVRELHRLVVEDLSPPPNGEGDQTPGEFRKANVTIHRSKHIPPDFATLQDYLDEFFDFINQPADPALDLLRVAVAHHRFAWIHPFNNGNGRVVRLLTYAMLISKGFDVRTGRILNPSAVFCSDREKYYDKLASADTGDDSAVLGWCEYVLQGLVTEVTKIDKLLNYKFLTDKILKPAVATCRDRQIISELEAKILFVAIEKVIFQASDIEHLFKQKLAAHRSRTLRQMRENHLIESISKNGRKYVICFSNSPLTRGFIVALADEDFISLD